MIKKYADKLFQWYCDPDYYPDIKGDLEELYHRNIQKSMRSANWSCFLQVMGLFRPSLIRSINENAIINSGTYRNYFKIGWRNLIKYRSYSMINILGLPAGFGATLLLLLIINYENSYDKFHTDYNQIFRVGTRYSDGNTDDMIVTPQIPLMAEEYADIVGATRFFDGWEGILQHDNTSLLTSIHLVDADFVDMFDFRILKGNVKDAFSTPNQIILTKSYAAKLFGTKEPMGQTVSFIDEDLHFTVVAIMEDPPENSSLKFEALIPWINAPSWLDVDQAGNWYNTFMNGYVQLSSQSDPQEIEEKLDDFVQRHFLEERKATSHIALLPLAEEHFRLTNNKQIIGILGIIAGAILLISCLNFMNLSMSQLLGRTKEIGLRKVMGSRSIQLIYQFIVEGLIVSSFAILIGLLTVYLILPNVNAYFSFDIHINVMENQSILYFLLGILHFYYPDMQPLAINRPFRTKACQLYERSNHPKQIWGIFQKGVDRFAVQCIHTINHRDSCYLESDSIYEKQGFEIQW